MSDPSSLEIMVQDFYKQLFLAENSCRLHRSSGITRLKLSDSQKRFMLSPFTMEEVKQALFEMAPFKAPGADGFHAAFYQHMWDIVGASLFEFACSFFKLRHPPSRPQSYSPYFNSKSTKR